MAVNAWTLLKEVLQVAAHFDEEVLRVELVISPVAVVTLLLGAFGDHLVDLRLDLVEDDHHVVLVRRVLGRLLLVRRVLGTLVITPL